MNWKIIGGGLLLVLFLGVCLFLGGKMTDEENAGEGVKPPSENTRFAKPTNRFATVKSPQKGNRPKKPSDNTPGKRPQVNVSTNTLESSPEQKRLDALQLALDDDNLEKVRAAAQELKGSSSPEVRGKIVEALTWFKQPAVVDLRGMLNDPDQGVASDAKEGWLDAVKTIEDDAMKAKELCEGMTRIQDLETLREAAQELYNIDDGVALQHTIPLINSGNPVAEQVGKEVYEHIAGDSYTTPDAAAKWIQNWRQEHPLETANQTY